MCILCVYMYIYMCVYGLNVCIYAYGLSVWSAHTFLLVKHIFVYGQGYTHMNSGGQGVAPPTTDLSLSL